MTKFANIMITSLIKGRRYLRPLSMKFVPGSVSIALLNKLQVFYPTVYPNKYSRSIPHQTGIFWHILRRPSTDFSLPCMVICPRKYHTFVSSEDLTSIGIHACVLLSSSIFIHFYFLFFSAYSHNDSEKLKVLQKFSCSTK